MNWIAAYLNAVKTNLPRAKREDLGEELQTLLEEEFESANGKPTSQATEPEILAWLRTQEHPTLVASRYHDRRVLIDEDAYPLFKLTLRYALIGIAVAITSATVITAVANGTFYLSPFDLLGRILEACLLGFASVTLVFHYFGRALNAQSHLAKWKPEELPDPQLKWEHEPWANSIAGLVFTSLFLLFINGFLTSVAQAISGEPPKFLQLKLVEEAATFLPWINLVSIVSILLYAYQIVKPYWSAATLSVHAALAAGTAWIVYHLRHVDPFLQLANLPEDKAQQASQLVSWVNTSISVTLNIVLLVSLYEIGRNLYRIKLLGKRRLY
ncbi:hypothetical protein VDG1235_1601 [Verrucomicrobiia bacterium DG1235]|nr:hypothetical protein VDG1235_1601 [Verrucomicrobiae bacterium DG1235]